MGDHICRGFAKMVSHHEKPFSYYKTLKIKIKDQKSKISSSHGMVMLKNPLQTNKKSTHGCFLEK
jgi:hypothetical protein